MTQTATTSVGEDFPKEQARVRQLLCEYRDLGAVGVFGATMIEIALRDADQAMASGDIVHIIRAYQALKDCQ